MSPCCVEDHYFWPCPADAPGPGCNIWIALSPMSVRRGGGLAIAAGSYRAPWRDEAIAAIVRSALHPTPIWCSRTCCRAIRLRSSQSQKRDGLLQTCQLETISPELHRECENVRKEWNMRPGDAIIHTR